MNATDVLKLRPYLRQDLEAAQAKYTQLLAECSHVYESGISALVWQSLAESRDMICSVCDRRFTEAEVEALECMPVESPTTQYEKIEPPQGDSES